MYRKASRPRALAIVQGRRGLTPGVVSLRKTATWAVHGLRFKRRRKVGGGLHRPAVAAMAVGTSMPAVLPLTENEASLASRAGSLREGSALLGAETTLLRALREEADGLLGGAARLLESVKQVRDDVADLPLAQLREANERLVVAAVAAQEAHEVAEQDATLMAHLAEHDALTGLPNRVLMKDRLTQAIGLARRNYKKAAVMYIDVDHFKYINDALGHDVGDRLLQSTASRLLACVRHSDTVSRQGGDEFVVLLSEVQNVHDAAVIAEKALRAMEEPHHIDGHALRVSLSIGISIFPDDADDEAMLMRNADVAMYHAKQAGRNHYQCFTAAMNEQAVQRQSVEAALRLALERQEFVVYYQPDVNLASGALLGAEALVRWQHPQQGLLVPERFMSVAEDSGLIVPIGKWVLREACRQMQAWLAAGFEVGHVAVNVSAVELRAKHFLKSVRATVEDAGLDPQRLEFEFTEAVLMRDAELSVSRLRALKAMGFHLSIDHFGTGYSSLSYLRRFPIDTLKIDQSFVHELAANRGDDGIAGAILALGKSLHYRVVADGVETQEQCESLQARGCAEGQGFLFGRPLGAEALTRH